MALYDRSKLQSFYSQMANDYDSCHYCEAEIKSSNIIKTFDDKSRAIRALAGKMSGKRIMKFEYMGHSFCICPECLSKINAEVNPEMETVIENDPLDISAPEEESTKDSDQTSTRKKAK